jgi:DNA polymerase III gamma/tau subunit
MVARHAWGSLRDAENLLEQLAVSYGGTAARGASGTGRESQPNEITVANVRELLGLGDTAAAIELASALLAGDASRALAAVNREAGRGTDLRALHTATIDALRAALLLKAGVQDALGHPADVVDAMTAAGRSVSMDRLLHVLSAMGQADLRGDSSPLQLELAVLKAVTAPQSSAPVQQGQAAVAQSPRVASLQSPYRPGPAMQAPPPRQPAPTSAVRTPAPPARRQPAPADDTDRDAPPPRQPASPSEQKWAKVTFALRRTKFKKFALGPLLKGAEIGEPQDGTLTVRFRHKSLRENIEEELQDARAREAIEKAIADAYGTPLKFAVAAGDAEGVAALGQSVASESPLVRAALAMGARIVEEKAAGGAP